MKMRLEIKKVGYSIVNKALVNFEAILKAKHVPLAKKEIKMDKFFIMVNLN